MEKRILVVEDDPQNRKLFRDLLEVSGYTVLLAEDGRQGVELARKERPGLILMDIQMPIMSGIEASRILGQDPDTREIPIVLLTAYAMEGDEEKYCHENCAGYMTKPINTRAFLGRVAGFFSQGEER